MALQWLMSKRLMGNYLQYNPSNNSIITLDTHIIQAPSELESCDYPRREKEKRVDLSENMGNLS